MLPLTTLLILTVTTLVLLQLSAFADHHEAKHNTLTDAEQKAGWVLLFDGKTTDGWRGYKKKTIPDGWKAVDGTLTRTKQAGDIVTVNQYDNFELKFDWKIAPNGNSGVFYRVTEDKGGPWETGPEYQVLDNDSTKYGDAKIETNIAGANYALYKSDRAAAKKAGKWNSGRIVCDGNHIEHWLNGKKVVEYEINSEEWKQRIAGSKFKQWPDCGQRKKGHIDLQDHGDQVWYRNMKLRPIQ